MIVKSAMVDFYHLLLVVLGAWMSTDETCVC